MKKLSARRSFGCGVSLAFTQNEREEVRYVGTDGNCAVALSAEIGSHQQNYVVQWCGMQPFSRCSLKLSREPIEECRNHHLKSKESEQKTF